MMAQVTMKPQTPSLRRSLSKIDQEQSKDTGMALVLLLLILALTFKRDLFLLGALGIQLLTMITPEWFRPAAFVWFGLSHLLGTFFSRIILTIVYFLVVTPVGLCRRALGVDTLQLTTFRASRDSVMQERNHTFVAGDVERPY
jgi:hypothetical protein